MEHSRRYVSTSRDDVRYRRRGKDISDTVKLSDFIRLRFSPIQLRSTLKVQIAARQTAR